MGYFVHAHYDKEMDERRETRIRAAITRCDAWGRTGSRVDWEGEGDDPRKPVKTKLEIYVDEQERAQRLASELRGCGMAVAVSQEATASGRLVHSPKD
jgi:hypothetical protein